MNQESGEWRVLNYLLEYKLDVAIRVNLLQLQLPVYFQPTLNWDPGSADIQRNCLQIILMKQKEGCQTGVGTGSH